MASPVSRLLCLLAVGTTLHAAEHVTLTGVPDYEWYAGCFGTAAGNLMGYWDRHGLPDIYTGPTADGVAPLNNYGDNQGIKSLWASRAGFDGRPVDKPGHLDDYWGDYYGGVLGFESTAEDPYVLAGRPEHEPDCLGDFMGQSQNKWADLGGECSGNINGYAFVFWEPTGAARTNFYPEPSGGVPVRDIPSGLREFSRYCGYEATVISQLADFNPTIPTGVGFTFEDLKAEIDAGYPVMLILQDPYELSRDLYGKSRVNPNVHAMVAYGYVVTDDGQALVRYRTSWASGDAISETASFWEPTRWQANLPLRGVICYRPAPKIVSMKQVDGNIEFAWHGPDSVLQDEITGLTRKVHRYVIERAYDLEGEFVPVTEPLTELQATVPAEGGAYGFYRVRLLQPE